MNQKSTIQELVNWKLVRAILLIDAGLIGLGLVLFNSSPAFTGWGLVFGAIPFFAIFLLGVVKALIAYFEAERDFQVNN